MQLSPVLVTEPCGSQAFSVRFSPDDTFLATAGAQGKVSIYNASTGQEAYRLNRNETSPVKQLCWRPEREDSSLRNRGVLVGASTDGKLRQWHVASRQAPLEWGDKQDAGQLFCVDYAPDGSKLVAGGMQELWLYDEETKKLTMKLAGGDTITTAGHSNRVFAVRFPPGEDGGNLVVSGGWDNTVQFWDLRAGHAVRSISGPHLCGDALDTDPAGRVLLTGSWRDEEALELWDVGTGRRLQTVPWRAHGSAEEPACLLYTARFMRGSTSCLAAGGSFAGPGGGEAKVLVRDTPGGFATAATAGAGAHGGVARQCAGTLARFTCSSADFSWRADPALVALCGSDGRTRVMRLSPPGAGAGAASARGERPPPGTGYPQQP